MYELKKPVALVGMMGSGKSAVGKAVSSALKVPFNDADDEIELAAQAVLFSVPAADAKLEFFWGSEDEDSSLEATIPLMDIFMVEPEIEGSDVYLAVRLDSPWGLSTLAMAESITLKVNGVERKAYATLKTDYQVDNIVIASETGSLGAGTSSPESRANVKPNIEVQGDEIRRVRVGEPLVLRTKVLDDGIPKPSRESRISESDLMRRMMRPPTRITVGKVNGLFLSWNVYRGEGDVTFDPPLPKPWEDTRTSANSPWGAMWLPPELPEDGMIETTATFSEPGTYILWARADDGGLYNDDYITVEVSE